MAETRTNIASVDPVWDRITDEAQAAVRDEPRMGGLLHACILHHKSLEKALSYRFAAKLSSNEMSQVILREIADDAHAASPELIAAARADLVAVFERDPACHRLLQPIMFFKGYQAMLAVQEHTAEVLVLLRGYMKLAELLDVRGRGEGLRCF